VPSKKIIVAFILMLIVSSIGIVYFYNNGPGSIVPRWIKHIFYFIWLITVYACGIFGLKNFKPSWIISAWHFLYLSTIAFAVSAEVFKKIAGFLPAIVLDATMTLCYFFQTPLPFVLLMAMSKIKYNS